jgi:hypothetical protein
LQKKNLLVERARRLRPRSKTLPHHLPWKTQILAGRVAVAARGQVLAALELALEPAPVVPEAEQVAPVAVVAVKRSSPPAFHRSKTFVRAGLDCLDKQKPGNGGRGCAGAVRS